MLDEERSDQSDDGLVVREDPDETEDGGEDDTDDTELQTQVEAVKAARERLAFMNLSGDSMLRLPESVEDAPPEDVSASSEVADTTE